MTTVYRSKTDAWIVAVLGAAIGICLYASVAVISAAPPSTWRIAAVTAVIGIGLPLWLLLSTRYTLEPRQLIVRCGPLKWRIAVADITAITPTNNPLSSPALSLDRLRIDYGKGRSLMVSPRDKVQFLRVIEDARREAARSA